MYRLLSQHLSQCRFNNSNASGEMDIRFITWTQNSDYHPKKQCVYNHKTQVLVLESKLHGNTRRADISVWLESKITFKHHREFVTLIKEMDVKTFFEFPSQVESDKTSVFS